jgi:hypothetical protein
VEGFELEVLKGAYQVLNDYHPKLFIEYCPKNLREQGIQPHELLSYLTNLGYRIVAENGISDLKKLELFEGMTDLFCDASEIVY